MRIKQVLLATLIVTIAGHVSASKPFDFEGELAAIKGEGDRNENRLYETVLVEGAEREKLLAAIVPETFMSFPMFNIEGQEFLVIDRILSQPLDLYYRSGSIVRRSIDAELSMTEPFWIVYWIGWPRPLGGFLSKDDALYMVEGGYFALKYQASDRISQQSNGWSSLLWDLIWRMLGYKEGF